MAKGQGKHGSLADRLESHAVEHRPGRRRRRAGAGRRWTGDRCPALAPAIGGKWIGWLGDVSALSAEALADVEQQLEALGMVPIHLSLAQVEKFYHGFSNRVLWSLFDYLIDRVPVDATGWKAYEEVKTVAGRTPDDFRDHTNMSSSISEVEAILT